MRVLGRKIHIDPEKKYAVFNPDNNKLEKRKMEKKSWKRSGTP